ncbi:pilus assembly protein CpaE [Roseivivax lentus]|uniref:Pilus assembly protein CpaE n=1 Tax=Roseivivax lentus TaxID=633194 RepID=A0A1N7M919_9RHOB|nr:P-loop NTPase [Roseivivax lentus]SIS82574.1 pilus assembly protein CpaE [Roseivivax lentus]
MIHDRDISDQILFVGPEDRVPKLRRLSLVASGQSDLGKLDHREIGQGVRCVLFTTDGCDADLKAISALKSARSGMLDLVALCDKDLPLARVRALTAAGASEVLDSSMSAQEIETALQVLAARSLTVPAQPAQTAKATVFAIAQARGGVGATTVAVNLAVALAAGERRGETPRVAILDLDLQFGNVGTYLDVEDNGGLLDLIAHSGVPDAGRILQIVQTSAHGVDVITAPSVFVPLSSFSIELAWAIVETLRARYDYLIIDLPHAALDWVGPVVEDASALVLVSDSSVPCIRHAKRLCDLYRETRVALPIEFVMNREKRHFFKTETTRDAEELLGVQVAAWLPEDTAAHRRAVDFGQPAACKRTATRKQYRKWAKRLAAASAGAHEAKRESADVQ